MSTYLQLEIRTHAAKLPWNDDQRGICLGLCDLTSQTLKQNETKSRSAFI